MIVLGKNKVDERYNISDEGIITDLNGNIQKCYLNQGRQIFKQVSVYRILMWTNFGWRDGKVWAIHHLDENPLNNSLSNLVFMIRSEHMSLHKKGKKLTSEVKAKMSEGKKYKFIHSIPKNNYKSKFNETQIKFLETLFEDFEN